MLLTKIREAKFDDIPVSIYQNEAGEYVLEYMKDGDTHQRCCTTDMLWEEMSEVFGEGVVPDAFQLIDLINKAEDMVNAVASEEELAAIVTRVITEHEQLMPAYIAEEMMAALKQRLHFWQGGYRTMVEVSLDTFFKHAIETKMIFRLNSSTYHEQYVRINKTIRSGEGLWLYLAVVNIEEDENEEHYWCEDSFVMVKHSDVILTHHKIDELPAEYTE